MTNGHLLDMELKILRSKQVRSLMGSSIIKRTPTPHHPLHKIATEIEKYNEGGKTLFPKACPRES